MRSISLVVLGKSVENFSSLDMISQVLQLCENCGHTSSIHGRLPLSCLRLLSEKPANISVIRESRQVGDHVMLSSIRGGLEQTNFGSYTAFGRGVVYIFGSRPPGTQNLALDLPAERLKVCAVVGLDACIYAMGP